MPKVEEADVVVEEYLNDLFESITSVKHLSLCVLSHNEKGYMYHAGIHFNKLEHLKLRIRFVYWSKLLFRLLQDSPKLRVLKLYINCDHPCFSEYEPISWNNSTVPECLLESLETFKFVGYRGRQEERDFVSFIIKNARRLKSSSILPCTGTETSDDSDGSDD